jgi:hypothetical protein
MSNTTAVATQQTQGGALASLAEIERAAQYIAKSNMFGVKTPEQAAALMLVAQSEGLHYARAAMAYDVICGRPALKSSEMLGRFQAAGGKIHYNQTTDELCELELEHPQGGKIAVKWDIARAKKAGLVGQTGKDTWTKYPAQMLRARAISEGIRALYPACLGGFYAPEEVQDFEPAQPVKAESEVVEPQKQPDLKVNLDGTPPPPPTTEAGKTISQEEANNIREFIGGLPDKNKATAIVRKYCKDRLDTLGDAQAEKLVAELKTEFGVTYDVTWRAFL